MAISSLINLNLETKEETDRLYFDQYEYCLKLRMMHFSCLRDMHKTTKEQYEVADSAITRLENRNRWNVGTSSWLSAFSSPSNTSSVKMMSDNLLDILDFLWAFRSDIKIMFSGDWGYIYSNSKLLLQQIASKHYITAYYIKQAVVTRDKNTISLKDPKNRFRSFLRDRQLDDVQKTQLLTYLSRLDDVRTSPALNYFLKYSSSTWTRRYFFFDHNDANIELMLRLILPEIIRQTQPIVAK